MTPNDVDRTLDEYKERVGRRGHLEAELYRLQTILADEMRNIEDIAAPKAQRFDNMDMPKSPGVGDPTASIGGRLADGFTPEHIKDLKIDIYVVKTEMRRNRETIMMVEGWLKGLTEKERRVIELQVFECETWAEIGRRFAQDYGGKDYTRCGLRLIKRKALEKIYKIAA